MRGRRSGGRLAFPSKHCEGLEQLHSYTESILNTSSVKTVKRSIGAFNDLGLGGTK